MCQIDIDMCTSRTKMSMILLTFPRQSSYFEVLTWIIGKKDLLPEVFATCSQCPQISIISINIHKHSGYFLDISTNVKEERELSFLLKKITKLFLFEKKYKKKKLGHLTCT